MANSSDEVTRMPTKILLVDEHPLIRRGMRLILEREPDMIVSAEAATSDETLKLADGIDLVLMDVSLPGSSGAEIARTIVARSRRTKVLILSASEDSSVVNLLFEAGARGYVFKRSRCDTIVRAIRIVMAGGTYLDGSPRPAYLSSKRPTIVGTAKLSVRESEVLKRVAAGATMNEVAKVLGLSPRTLDTYKYRAMRKLDLHTRADLIRYAASRGWLRQA